MYIHNIYIYIERERGRERKRERCIPMAVREQCTSRGGGRFVPGGLRTTHDRSDRNKPQRRHKKNITHDHETHMSEHRTYRATQLMGLRLNRCTCDVNE